MKTAHLRINVPDRPGALARVARALADVGADILSVTVLERDQGRAVDDLYVDWPSVRSLVELVDAIATCRGARVVGVRRCAYPPSGRPELDLLEHLTNAPGRGLELLVDLSPGAFAADWAALVRRSEEDNAVVYASTGAPAPVPVPSWVPGRAYPVTTMCGPLAVIPIARAGQRLLVGRRSTPAFTRGEIVIMTSVVELAGKVIRTAYQPPSRRAPTTLTGGLINGGRSRAQRDVVPLNSA